MRVCVCLCVCVRVHNVEMKTQNTNERTTHSGHPPRKKRSKKKTHSNPQGETFVRGMMMMPRVRCCFAFSYVQKATSEGKEEILSKNLYITVARGQTNEYQERLKLKSGVEMRGGLVDCKARNCTLM